MIEDGKRLTHNYLFSLAAQACQLLGPMITMPYVSRVLGVENIGLYSASAAMAAYFILAANFGSSVYGQKRIAAQGIEERSGIFWSVVTFRSVPFVGALLSWIIYVLCSQETYRPLLFVQGLAILSVFLDVTWLFQGLQDFRSTALRTVISRILGVMAVFLLVKNNQDTVKYVAIEMSCVALGNLSLWLKLPGLVHRPKAKEIHPLDCMKESFQFFIPGLAVQAYTALDKVLLNIIGSNLVENGYYEQATKIVRFITSVLTVYSTVWFPRMAALFSGDKKETKEKARSEIQQGTQFVSFLGIPLIVALELTAPFLVHFYLGDGFAKCAILIRIMAPNILVIGISTALGQQFFNPSGRQNISTGFVFAGAFVSCVINLLLIVRIASVGTAIASMLTELVITILFVVYTERKGYFRVIDFLKGSRKHFLASVLMGVVVYLMPKSSLIGLAATAAVGIAVYLAALWLMKDEQLQGFYRSLK